MNPLTKTPRRQVIGISITPLSISQHVDLILDWAMQNASRAVCVANVHMLMEAHWDPGFRRILNAADLVTPDGMPLVWMLRLLGIYNQERVAGMDLLKGLCEKAQRRSVGILFLGSSTQILTKMRHRLDIEYPNLNIIGMDPLPFRPLTPSEDRDLIHRINQEKAGLLLLSLGCPKQEKWIAAHRGKINATMIGLGGVFPVYAGLQAHAPKWAREAGLEWLYRLYQEPRRLWRRYATTIPPFLWLAVQQLANRSRRH